MKTKLKFILSLAMVLLMAGLFEACKKDDPTPAVVIDKVALNAAITAAVALQTNVVDGKAAGQYTVGAKAAFQTAIDAAKAIATSTTSTQIAVDNAVTALAAATVTLNSKLIAEIDPTNLVGYWKFSEGTGTSTADASGGAHNGTLTAGNQFAGGGGAPTWVADRAGVAGKALHFTKGGHVLVPSSATFNPTELTIALWVNMDSVSVADMAILNAHGTKATAGVYSDNYMISQNYWDGYKLQSQEAKKLYGTVHAVPSIYDRDTDNSPAIIKLKKWTHVAMTFKDGEMDLYINGLVAKQWTNTPGVIKTMTDRFDFVIGQEKPNAKIETVDPGYVINHFEGSMDDIRLYKKFLTTAQLQSIYDMEKP